jgi:glyoxylase-like metal-dependent hydrolase (beta-lactamase superfamily II)
MQLEDHLGDIIRKIRKANNISVAAAAAAAGISETELTALEDTGKTSARVNYPALAGLIGLDGKKLESIAKGYLPAPKDLSVWRSLRMFTTPADEFTVNYFLVWDEATREAALFDTGVDARPILNCLTAGKMDLKHIFITHSHWDHVDALPKIREAFPKAKIHSGSRNAPVDQRLKNNETTHLGGLSITHRDTPGHADDGVTYLVGHWQKDAPQIAVVGDTIFAGSMGNGNGHWDLARQKIRTEILSLPPATLICPGHGPLTTVGEEKLHNPFF